MKNSFGAEIVIPKIPSYKILDLCNSINAKAEIRFIGKRPGEKLHEEMISDDESENKIRRSRRLERKEEVGESNLLDCGADFDEANIIEGKRKRKRVNYRKLNDMMFGDLSDHQQGIIDGGDDFDTTKTKLVRDGSENEESNGNASDNGSENTSENELASDSDDNSAN